MSSYSNFGSSEFAKKICKDLDGIAYSVGIESDKKQRGSAVNIDVKEEDLARELIVVQVRESHFHPRRYTRVTKQYLLCGRNENGNAFAHPLPTRLVSNGGNKVRRALAWVWDCELADIDHVVRNGDVAFVPVHKLPAVLEPLTDNKITLAESHVLSGELFSDGDGNLYAKKASIKHSKHQHPTARNFGSLRKVMIGQKHAGAHFAQPTAD